MTVIADSSWINSDECVLPVTIDPQIKLTNNGFLKTYVYTDGVIKEPASDTNALMFYCNNGKYEEQQPYLSITKPTLPKNPRIKKAELELTISSFLHSVLWNETDQTTLFGLYNVTGDVVLGGHNPTCDSLPFDYAGICDSLKTGSTMCFDITDQIDQLLNGDKNIVNLKFGFISDDYKDAYISFYNHKSSKYCPKLNITYESSYGINSSYRTHTHELGRFGQGNIDLQCGNLMFESTDFAWGGNRMPVTIKHLYNSALSGYQYNNNDSIKLRTADFSSMKIGNGFKLNLMQSMKYTSFQDNGSTYYGYVFIDENGNETYFKHSSSETAKIDDCCTETCNVYEDIETGDMRYHEGTHTLVIGDDKYQFDENGRLISITDKYNNQLSITYTNDRITSITDGAGRDFCFDYDSNGFLSAIAAPNHTNENPVLIQYGYSGNNLSTITYEDGRKVAFDYIDDKPSCVTLYDKNGNSVYKVEYTFINDKLKTVTEYGVENRQFVLGTTTEYTYSAASGRTHVKTTEPADDGESTDNVIDTVYVFDDGELINEYFYSDDIGNVLAKGDAAGGINPYSGEDGAKYTKNTVNLLSNHDFTTLDYWVQSEDSSSFLTVEKGVDANQAKYGNTFLKITSNSLSCIHKGASCTYNNLPAGKYTFSAYVRAVSEFVGEWSPGALIFVRDSDGNMLSYGECLKGKDDNYTRLIAPFELAKSQTIKLELLVNGKGTAYFDAAQLEKNDFASAYNMLKNGSFETGWSGWTASKIEVSTDESFDGDQSLILPGTLTKTRFADQYVSVSNDRDTRETFTLSGWAKGFALPVRERNGIEKSPEFNITAIIQYYDTEKKEYGNEKFVEELSTATEEWQYFSIQFAKTKHCKISTLQIRCNYNYNLGNAYFDNLQLVRDSIETGLSENDFSNDDNGSVDSEIITTGDTKDRSLSEFEELIDECGNALTETTFSDNELGTIYRAFEFTSGNDNIENAGNDLVAEIDARGNKTEYTVDEETSRNEEVIDRCGNITVCEYDNSGKTTKVTSKNLNRDELANVSYAYDAFDNMKEIVRGDGLKYVLKYNAFHDLESIGIDGKTDGDLVKYTYKNGGGKLKQITYANGHTMKAKYNSIGQMISEIWSDTNDCIVAHYKYAYDGEGNIVRSIDICDGKEYNYIYEGDKLVRATEYSIVVNDDIVVSKILSNNVLYAYKSEELFSKHIVVQNGEEHTAFYEKTDGDNTSVKFTTDDKDILIRSKNDSFGRKEFEEIQHQNGYLYRKFTYLNGEISDAHKENLKVKSEATTQLVSQITFSDGRTISYEYDAEERITKVIDSVNGITEYTYDALGQLETEIVNGVIVNNMTYDNYGNILFKNGVTYTYGDPVWKDKLTKVGDQEIIYDTQGNPTKYLGYDLVWEKGRQLKWFDTNCYTYNANGIRTSKTVDFVRHDFVLEGSKILRETWEDNILIPLYDTDDSICGIIYNDEPYYFQKNLQGDIIAINDCNSQVIARYSYDAWGVCNIVEDTSGCNIANVNPYRYRGYYYDDETGMYYLQSRYYDPVIGRFINSDNIEFVNSTDIKLTNLFSYCSNEPILNFDYTGTLGWSTICKGISYIFDFFVQITRTAANMSKEMANIIKKIKCANTNGASKAWIKELKVKKKSLTSPKRLGVGKLNAISNALNIIITIMPYISYIRRIKEGIKVFAELVVDLLLDILSIVANFIVSLICKFIPYAGFLLGWALGYIVDLVIAKVFNNNRKNRIKSIYSNRVKNSNSFKYWITSVGYSVSKCF